MDISGKKEKGIRDDRYDVILCCSRVGYYTQSYRFSNICELLKEVSNETQTLPLNYHWNLVITLSRDFHNF